MRGALTSRASFPCLYSRPRAPKLGIVKPGKVARLGA